MIQSKLFIKIRNSHETEDAERAREMGRLGNSVLVASL